MATALAAATDAQQQQPEIWMLPVDLIDPAPDNPRADVGDIT